MGRLERGSDEVGIDSGIGSDMTMRLRCKMEEASQMRSGQWMALGVVVDVM